MSKPFQVGDNVRTRDGREARILMMDGGGDQPIMGAMRDGDGGHWTSARWNKSGAYRTISMESPFDLIHIPETRTVTVKIYLMEDGRINAHPAALEPHISGEFGSQTVELTFEEGRHG